MVVTPGPDKPYLEQGQIRENSILRASNPARIPAVWDILLGRPHEINGCPSLHEKNRIRLIDPFPFILLYKIYPYYSASTLVIYVE